MKWNFDDDNFSNNNPNNYNKLCPICQQRLLEAKLAKLIEINHYLTTKNELLMIEEIKAKIEKIKREEETQWYIYYCTKHRHNNTL